MREYISKGCLTREEANQLREDQKNNLHCAYLHALFINGHLGFEQLRDLRNSQRCALQSEFMREKFIRGQVKLEYVDFPLFPNYITDGWLSLPEYRSLFTHQQDNLNAEHILQLYSDGYVSYEDARDLRPSQREALEVAEVRLQFINGEIPLEFIDLRIMYEYFKEGSLTLAYLEEYASQRLRQNLNSLFIRQLYLDGYLSFEEACDLQDSQREALASEENRVKFIAGKLLLEFVDAPHIQDCVDNHSFTLAEARMLSVSQKWALKSAEIREKVLTKKLALSLVEWPDIQSYIDHGCLTLKEAGNLSDEQRCNLNDENILALFVDGYLSYRQARDLGCFQAHALTQSDVIRERFKSGKLALEFVAIPTVQDYVDEGCLTLQEACALEFEQQWNLNSAVVRRLYQSRLLSFEEARGLKEGERGVLHHYSEKRDPKKPLTDIVKRVRNAAMIRRNVLTLFFTPIELPELAKVKIASMTGDLTVHDKAQSEVIAGRKFVG